MITKEPTSHQQQTTDNRHNMNDDSVNITDLELKFGEYAKFVRDVLRPDYQVCLNLEQEIQNEIRDYVDLCSRITKELLPKDYNDDTNPLILNVDLGHDKVSCRAKVEATSGDTVIFVHVGMGFHVEYQWEEAVRYISKRIDYLQNIKLPHRQAKSKHFFAHLQSSERILDELSHELQRMTK